MSSFGLCCSPTLLNLLPVTYAEAIKMERLRLVSRALGTSFTLAAPLLRMATALLRRRRFSITSNYDFKSRL